MNVLINVVDCSGFWKFRFRKLLCTYHLLRAQSAPDGWNDLWNSDNRSVIWSYNVESSNDE